VYHRKFGGFAEFAAAMKFEGETLLDQKELGLPYVLEYAM
jgi:hypothetical protein